MEIENIWVVVCKECGKIYKYDNKTQLFLDDNEKPTEQYFSSIFDTLVKFLPSLPRNVQ